MLCYGLTNMGQSSSLSQKSAKAFKRSNGHSGQRTTVQSDSIDRQSDQITAFSRQLEAGKDIPFLARMFAVVDAFDALTSHRSYRQKITAEEALAYLREKAKVLFDPDTVLVFEKLGLEGRASDLLTSG